MPPDEMPIKYMPRILLCLDQFGAMSGHGRGPVRLDKSTRYPQSSQGDGARDLHRPLCKREATITHPPKVGLQKILSDYLNHQPDVSLAETPLIGASAPPPHCRRGAPCMVSVQPALLVLRYRYGSGTRVQRQCPILEPTMLVHQLPAPCVWWAMAASERYLAFALPLGGAGVAPALFLPNIT